MKKYFCDVCGVELAAGGKTLTASPDSVVTLCNLEDLCPRCEGLVRELDASALVLKELRRMAQAPPEPEPAPDPAPVPIGWGAAEKKEILAAISVFRQERGAGALGLLAEQSEVEESVLRDMIQCQKVPMVTWRKVGRALSVKECQ